MASGRPRYSDQRLPVSPRADAGQNGRHPNWGHPDHDACGTGFVARLGGSANYDIIQYALTALERLTHRGGVDADGASGDGAGLLTSLPEDFLRKSAEHEGIRLPDLFGLGMVFVPAASEQGVRSAVEVAARAEQIRVLGWRRVPTDPSTLGPRALATMPRIWQFFLAPSRAARGAERFETRLTSLRKRAELLSPKGTYFCSVSSRMVVYKGLLTPWQLPKFYADLRDESFEISFSIFHQRYSTNTKPSWQLAQPFRYTAHNGEINTIVSNRRWLRARERAIRKNLGAGPWFRLLEENVSDSASFDNALEWKLLEEKTIESAMLSLVPPAFAQDPFLSADVCATLQSLSSESEAWDGPAALVFSDGISVGAKLDRNGLRPMRYTVTHDGLVIAGSETGLVDLDESRVAERQRLGPGEMLIAIPEKGLLLRWREILKSVTSEKPRAELPPVRGLEADANFQRVPVQDPKRVAGASGWSDDQYKILFRPLLTSKEADWSMGDDAPLAFMSALPRSLWDYCRQRFAQVTNPPIDPLRESHVMSLDVQLNAGICLPGPLLSCAEFAALLADSQNVQRIDFTFPARQGVLGARRCLTQCFSTPLSDGERPGLLLLSDRGIGADRAALPVLLATARAWKQAVEQGWADVPVIVETAQVFDTHHVAMLLAAGASAVVPYLAEEFE